ncbi:unnamed protein product [Boreogadus saida]
MLPCRAWGCGRLSSVPNDRHQHMGVRSDTVSSLDQPPGCSSIQNVPVSIKAVWKLTLLPDEAKALPLSGRWFTTGGGDSSINIYTHEKPPRKAPKQSTNALICDVIRSPVPRVRW